jgi:hypothetical protein
MLIPRHKKWRDRGASDGKAQRLPPIARSTLEERGECRIRAPVEERILVGEALLHQLAGSGFGKAGASLAKKIEPGKN